MVLASLFAALAPCEVVTPGSSCPGEEYHSSPGWYGVGAAEV
jgi:hypothetical protein